MEQICPVLLAVCKTKVQNHPGHVSWRINVRTKAYFRYCTQVCILVRDGLLHGVHFAGRRNLLGQRTEVLPLNEHFLRGNVSAADNLRLVEHVGAGLRAPVLLHAAHLLHAGHLLTLADRLSVVFKSDGKPSK